MPTDLLKTRISQNNVHGVVPSGIGLFGEEILFKGVSKFFGGTFSSPYAEQPLQRTKNKSKSENQTKDSDWECDQPRRVAQNVSYQDRWNKQDQQKDQATR